MSRFTTIAAVLMFISALLHVAAPVLTGFATENLSMLIFAVIYGVLGWLILKNKRWAVWLGFFLMLFGGIAGMAAYLGASSLPEWLNLSIWIASWAAAVCLFVVLWRDHTPAILPAQNE